MSSLTPVRDVFAAEVTMGDVITTEHGPRTIQSVVHLNGNVHLYYRVPRGLDYIVRPHDTLITIRDVAVIS